MKQQKIYRRLIEEEDKFKEKYQKSIDRINQERPSLLQKIKDGDEQIEELKRAKSGAGETSCHIRK